MTSRERRSDTPQKAEHFFCDCALGGAVFRQVQATIGGLGGCDLRVDETQVGWARRRGFAFLWLPGRWLQGQHAEVVLSVGLPRHDDSPRWKQVTEVRPGLFMHHLELRATSDIDSEVDNWLAEAFEAAG